MLVYIQKKIKNVWRTVITVQSDKAGQVFDHLCQKGCPYEYRLSTEKTDDPPIKPKVR